MTNIGVYTMKNKNLTFFDWLSTIPALPFIIMAMLIIAFSNFSFLSFIFAMFIYFVGLLLDEFQKGF